MSNYSAAEQEAIRRDNRAMEAEGVSMVDELDFMRDSINDAAIGITSRAGDLDALALAARDAAGVVSGQAHFFGQDFDTTSGLDFGYKAGRFNNGSAIVTVSAGTITLSASATNYVEVNRAGVVSKNTSGFTAGQFPLYEVVTGASSITSVTNRKCPYTLIGDAGITGTQLSTMAKTKGVEVRIDGTKSATFTVAIIAPSHACKLSKLSAMVETTIGTSDTDYWTATAVNKGPAGSGSTALLAAVDGNTTKATGGAGLTNFVDRNFTLHGTPTNLDLAANDVILVTFTKTASGANWVNPVVKAEFTFTG